MPFCIPFKGTDVRIIQTDPLRSYLRDSWYPLMNPLAAILLLLVAAKGLGELLERAGYPSIIGEIGTAALHGPAVLNIVKAEATIEVFIDVGLSTLLFMNGAQLNLRTSARSERAGFWIACVEVTKPLASLRPGQRVF